MVVRPSPTVLTRRSRRRGFTVAEVVAGAVVAGLLVSALLAWVTDLMDLNRQAGVVSAIERDANFATGRFVRDVAGAAPCGLENVAVRALADDQVVFFADEDSDGDLDLVAWRLDGDRLERAVTADAICSSPVGDYQAIIDHVATADAPVFAGLRGTTVLANPGDCSGAAAAGCNLDSLRLRFLIEGDGAGRVAQEHATMNPAAGTLGR